MSLMSMRKTKAPAHHDVVGLNVAMNDAARAELGAVSF